MAFVLAAVFAAIVGWVDYTQEAVQPTVACIGVFSFFLAFWRPRRGWILALVVAGGVPVTHAAMRHLGKFPPYWVEGGWAALIGMPLVPAAVGAVAGVVARRLVTG